MTHNTLSAEEAMDGQQKKTLLVRGTGDISHYLPSHKKEEPCREEAQLGVSGRGNKKFGSGLYTKVIAGTWYLVEPVAPVAYQVILVSGYPRAWYRSAS